MLKLLTLTVAVLALGASAAQASASQRWAVPRWGAYVRTMNITHKDAAQRKPLVDVSCPETQTITVVNEAHVGLADLARAEQAVIDQSVQVRAAWGTPCVAFAPGGWPLYLRSNSSDTWGVHFAGPIRAYVWTAGNTHVEGWSVAFSHEIVEMLEDPINTGYYRGGAGYQLEIADPVDTDAYRLDGVYVSDFVLPAWYAGGQAGPQACNDQGCSFGPLITSETTGPYDEMHLLTAPWQTQEIPSA